VVYKYLKLAWDWYFMPGLWILLAIFFTEILRSFSYIKSNVALFPVMIGRLVINYYQWPIFLAKTVWVYLSGETIISFDALKLKAIQEAIRKGLYPLRRYWVRGQNDDGQKMHGYFSEYMNVDSGLDIRATHVVTVSLDSKTLHAYRFVSRSEPPLPLGLFNSLSKARKACSEDFEWLELSSPAKEFQRWEFYKTHSNTGS